LFWLGNGISDSSPIFLAQAANITLARCPVSLRTRLQQATLGGLLQT
jgi:hypothetical protein